MDLRWPVLVATGALAVAIAASMRFVGSSPPHARSEMASTPSPPPSRPLTFQGSAHYRFLYEAQGSFRFDTSGSSRPQDLSARVEGVLTIAQGGASVLALSGLSGHVTMGTHVSSMEGSSLTARLLLARDGSVALLKYQGSPSPTLENLSKILLTTWRLRDARCASPCEKESWTAREETPFGSATASHELLRDASLMPPASLSDSNVYRIHRRLAGQASDAIAGDIRMNAALSPLGILVPSALEATLSTRNAIAGQAEAKSETRISMTLVSYEREPAASGDAHEATPPATAREESTLAAVAGAQDTRSFLAEKIKGHTTQSVMEEIKDLQRKHSGRPVPAQESIDTYLRLKALALLEPDALPELAATLRNAPAQDLAWQLLAGALVSAGTDEAQSALVEVARQRLHETALATRIVILLASSEAPLGSAARSFLTEISRNPNLAPELRSTSQLALGVAARTAAGVDPEWADSMVRSIQEALLRARKSPEVTHWLGVAGNAGNPKLLPQIRSHLTATDEAVRSQAVFSLRFQPEAEPLLLTALDDASAAVRGKAVEALGFGAHGASAGEALAARYSREPEAGVRMKILSALWQMRADSDVASDTVRAASQTDKEPRVRSMALTLLGGESRL